MAGLRDDDEENGKDDPPKIVSELAAELLADEVASWLFVPRTSAQAVSEDGKWIMSIGIIIWNIGCGVIGVDAEGTFFVDIGIAHSDGNRVDVYVHHNNVENKETYA